MFKDNGFAQASVPPVSCRCHQSLGYLTGRGAGEAHARGRKRQLLLVEWWSGQVEPRPSPFVLAQLSSSFPGAIRGLLSFSGTLLGC